MDKQRDAQDRLQAVIAAYGADPRRWPEQDQSLAALLERSDAAVDAALAEASAIDEALGAVEAITPSSELRARILADASGAKPAAFPAHILADMLGWMTRPLGSSVALASAGVLGVLIGINMDGVISPFAGTPEYQLALASEATSGLWSAEDAWSVDVLGETP